LWSVSRETNVILQLLPESLKALKDYLVRVFYEDERIRFHEVQSIENEALKGRPFIRLSLTEINVRNREQLLK